MYEKSLFQCTRVGIAPQVNPELLIPHYESDYHLNNMEIRIHNRLLQMFFSCLHQLEDKL